MIILSEDFKEKLKAYREGRLTGEEREEIEKELDKIEEYQTFLEEEMDNSLTKDAEGENEVVDINTSKSERRIIKRAKWKARIHNAFTAIGIVIAFTFVCGVITSLFYLVGEPNRMDVYKDIVRSTIAVTEPNISFGHSENSAGAFFTLNIDGKLRKKIGSSEINIGQANFKFLFNKCTDSTRKWGEIEDGYSGYMFQYPDSKGKYNFEEEWSRLDKLPEGTVAEVCISLDKFYKTDEILSKFKELDMKPLWFAVDTGFDDESKQRSEVSFSPIGFPYQPMWHDDDMKIISSSEKKGFLFSRVKTISKSSPSIEEYGSGNIRNENFIKTLVLLKKYEKIAEKIANSDLKLQQRIDYIKSNGVNIYGVVVTGPTKEILKLKNEKWVSGVKVGDVELWNWTE